MMKLWVQNFFILALLPSFFIQFISLNELLAKDALYIVPTEPDLVEFSRFNIKIIKSYKNQMTEKIAYEFPEILVGEKNKVIEFLRVPGTANSWQAPEAEAHCSTFLDIFSCNIHLNKNPIGEMSNVGIAGEVLVPKRLSMDLTLENLKKMSMPALELEAFSRVVEDFFSNEPAGILMYEI